MMAMHNVKLKPFTVPNYVRLETAPQQRGDGYKETPCFALCELDDDTLEELCRQFREDVFKKARGNGSE